MVTILYRTQTLFDPAISERLPHPTHQFVTVSLQNPTHANTNFAGFSCQQPCTAKILIDWQNRKDVHHYMTVQDTHINEFSSGINLHLRAPSRSIHFNVGF
jgi:hypothetical protein